MQNNWESISSAPRDNSNKLNYILISDGVCLPDIVMWKPTQKAKPNCMYIPEGWFCPNGTRSRILNPTIWTYLPELP